ncbi:hypothetical protein Sjap_008219 [Stephania japonica]|uniref:Uncharacterized protein n=1 Tax=Stephania japonica TaxID=461633 RepID=A0AAP0JRC2_9MAGN
MILTMINTRFVKDSGRFGVYRGCFWNGGESPSKNGLNRLKVTQVECGKTPSAVLQVAAPGTALGTEKGLSIPPRRGDTVRDKPSWHTPNNSGAKGLPHDVETPLRVKPHGVSVVPRAQVFPNLWEILEQIVDFSSKTENIQKRKWRKRKGNVRLVVSIWG